MLSFSRDPNTAEKQMHAVIFYLTAFGYIDNDFDDSEKEYIRAHVARLVEQRARDVLGGRDPQRDVVERWTRHFHEVAEEIDREIRDDYSESVADGESQHQYVLARLKLRCFELFKTFDEENRKSLLDTVDELMHADGVVHPSEQAFRDELFTLLESPIELDDAEFDEVPPGSVVIHASRRIAPRETNHPFFKNSEWDYATDPATFARQAQLDMRLIEKVTATLDAQRIRGAGRLATTNNFGDFAGQEPFLDGHVYVHQPREDRDYELLVIGDLHGCYSCLKAALLQADFFAKVQAHHNDPANNPETKLVLLGDYIDRGRYSYNGILRTAMQLFVTVPEHVYLLRGNHEYYVELDGRVLAPVRPAEAYFSLEGIAPNDMFAAYMRLFDALPNMLVFDRTLFVHAGIPRDEELARRWTGLESLNDSDLRFQMLWSDPSSADYIPDELQKANARFPFGRRQFKNFMQRVGLTTMVRGHERITEGFRKVYDSPEARLLTLFSAGGKNNDDLPQGSNYREVTPMALTVRHKGGLTEMTPFVIDYERYNDPRYNEFLKSRLVAI